MNTCLFKQNLKRSLVILFCFYTQHPHKRLVQIKKKPGKMSNLMKSRKAKLYHVCRYAIQETFHALGHKK